MNPAIFSSHWALIAAALPALIAFVLISRNVAGRTAKGQLSTVLKNHRATRKALEAARKERQKALARAEKLSAKAGQIPPRTLREATEAAEDARSLEKIAHDRVLVTANHLRRVIVEEFPPTSHEKLRRKYLPEDGTTGI